MSNFIALKSQILRPIIARCLAAFCVMTGFFSLGGCQEGKPQGQSEPRPVVEDLPAISATADVDRRATMALKQDLLTRFSQTSTSVAVETALSQETFECGPNPAAPKERACLKIVREGPCEVNTIVRTSPYNAEKAQVIRICELTQAPPKP